MERVEKVLLEVLVLPGRFWKKYCSWGGRSWGGVGVRFRRVPFRPLFDGVTGAAGSAMGSSSLLSRIPSSSAPSASHICLARLSSSSISSSPPSSAAMDRSTSDLAHLRRADRSALRTIGFPAPFEVSTLAFEGVSKSFLPFCFERGVSWSWRVSGVALGFVALPGGRPRRRFEGVLGS